MLGLAVNRADGYICAKIQGFLRQTLNIGCEQTCNDLALVKAAIGEFFPVQGQRYNNTRVFHLPALIFLGNALRGQGRQLNYFCGLRVVFKARNNLVYWGVIGERGKAAVERWRALLAVCTEMVVWQRDAALLALIA
tara:strand:+ start:15892 stop:16302 length:411 start_codon:yes stop_codon:yes gene_type:complete